MQIAGSRNVADGDLGIRSVRLEVEAVGRVVAERQVNCDVSRHVNFTGQLNVPAGLIESHVEPGVAREVLGQRQVEDGRGLVVIPGHSRAGKQRKRVPERRETVDRPVACLVEDRPAVREREEPREACLSIRRVCCDVAGLGAETGSRGRRARRVRRARDDTRQCGADDSERRAGRRRKGAVPARQRVKNLEPDRRSVQTSCVDRVADHQGKVFEDHSLLRAAEDVRDRDRALAADAASPIEVVDVTARQRQRVRAVTAGEVDAARQRDRAVRAVDRERVDSVAPVEDDLRDAEDARREDLRRVQRHLEQRRVARVPRDNDVLVPGRAVDRQD